MNESHEKSVVPVAAPAPDQFFEAMRALDLTVDESRQALLQKYLERLLETNQSFNLTSVSEPGEAWMRHILDSLSLLPFVRDAALAIDVGSGGGLPGLPLAIMQPQMQWVLLEATGKKARFLEEAVAALKLTNVRVICDRAEAAGQDPAHRQKFDLAVSRATGPLNVLLELTLPLLREGGKLLAMKGRKAEEELQACGDALYKLGGGDVQVFETLPGWVEDAVVVMVEKDRPTPKAYPRRPGQPKQMPL